MTSEAASAAIVPPLRARDSLLWTVPLTALWTWLLYAQPVLLQSGLPALAARLATYGLIGLGTWLGLERTDLTPAQRRTTWLAIMVPFTLWAAVAWSAAINGVFRTGYSQLPLLPAAIFLPVVIGAALLLLSKRVGQLLDAMPTNWLVALQLYRIVGSQWLAHWLLGQLPGLWALPAGTGDVLTGLFAVPAAMALASGTAEGRKPAILWNLFGIADFVVAITLGMIITPGPFQLIFPEGPNVGLDNYPNVLTPAFVVPSSILLHALSLRQLRRRSRSGANVAI
ncbi:MFS transporter [Bradyrhizobium sp. BR 10261]|uniref:MFS transporter n=1 Tax=Bradyrhizobium sp. BR 10261 TaxID=2749992 RepID=UPI001C64EAED|nr:MFS transporter [Bradyrhizobium sp. BR 10261]MBW7962319.1 MFS transporter [Bradyrhizobium sp. BR 10261]